MFGVVGSESDSGFWVSLYDFFGVVVSCWLLEFFF